MAKKPLDQNDFIEVLRKIFVTIEVFELKITPLEKLVYGFVGVVLLAVLGAIIALVIRK